MKIFGLVLLMGLLAAGCATYHHAEYIDTDQLQGYASGKYNLSSTGPSGNFALAGSGGGIGSAGGAGFGLGAIAVSSKPPDITPYYFARSIAMINYSKKLKYIKYDEAGGIIEYEFDQQPLPKKSAYQPTIGRSNLPSSFGHQPIE